MKAFQVCIALAAFAASVFTQPAVADVSHIGIEAMDFEAGELPKLNVNVVSDHNDLSLLTFYIRQKYKNTIVLEKLIVDDHKQNTFILRGEEKIIDPNSSLIVSEYRNGKWQQYSPVSLFKGDLGKQTASHQADKPVAIKTMKSSTAYKQRHQNVVAQPQAKPESRYSSSIASTSSSTSNRYSSSADASQSDCIINKSVEDTLWKLGISNAKQWGTNVFGAMIAIYETNPDAFINNNIQKLKADSKLNCPSGKMLAQFQSPNQDKLSFDALVAGKISKAEHNNLDDQVEMVQSDDQQSQRVKASEVTALPEAIEVIETIEDEIVSLEVSESELVADEPYLISECVINKLPQDSLWSVATANHKQWNTSIFGAILAIYEVNPSAFSGQNIQQLRADATLDCPSEDILKQYQNAQADKLKFDELVARQQSN
ncbi:FimV/HubP family polar landmark protein [Shewanella sp. HL-SH5]|uniref:FimV/HubP family polar landmark protein n=1 Tax=Shewanella sp. HL-SH5 TaxID=3436241 RepID=UPI003EBA217B